MKTLTEFSTLTLRKAAAARAAVGGRPAAPVGIASAASGRQGQGGLAPDAERSEAYPGSEPPPAAEPAEAAAAEPVEGDVPAEGGEPAESGEPAEGGEPAASAAEPAAPADPAVGAVAEALGVQPDRAARLLEALDIVGDAIDQVRLVRVFQGDKGPHNAISKGEFHYVVDRVAGPPRRSRDDRRGGREGGRGGREGGRGGGGGGGGGGGFGGERRDKPRGLGSLKIGAKTEERDPRDDRPGRGEMPRAGIGWQLTAAPRDFGDRGRGRGGPKRGPRNTRGPGGPGGPGGPSGPGGPGGNDRRDDRRARGPRNTRGPRPEHAGGAPHHGSGGPGGPVEPRLGPDGQPLPPRSKRRERKPIGPDANGLGPDGTPWDPERRAKRVAEREARVNTPETAAVEATTPVAETVTETPGE